MHSNNPRKILLITGTYPPSACGVGDHSACLASSLERLGHEVFIATSRVGSRINQGIQLDVWDREALRRIEAYVREKKISLVILQYPTGAYGRGLWINLLPLVLRKKTGVPVILLLHEYSTLGWKGRTRAILTAYRANKVAIAGPEDVPRLIRGLGKWQRNTKEKCQHVPIGPNIPHVALSETTRQKLRSANGIEKEDFLLGYWGFLSEQKGFTDLLETIPKLIKKKVPVKLMVVGSLEPIQLTGEQVRLEIKEYHQRIKEVIKAKKLKDKIVVTGHLSDPQDVSRHLQICDLVVLPFREGGSIRRGTLVGALSQGLPVVTTQANPPRHSLEKLTPVTAQDIEMLTNRIEQLYLHPDQLKELRKVGQRLSSIFNWEGIGRQIVDLS